jgi:hypothetical protein
MNDQGEFHHIQRDIWDVSGTYISVMKATEINPFF